MMAAVTRAVVGWLALLVLGGVVAGCGGADADATPTPTAVQQELTAATEAWEAHAVDAYRMQVTYRKGGWAPQVLQVLVQEGQVEIEEHTCFPERTCGVRPVAADNFSLDAILAFAAQQAAKDGIEHLVYHDEYSFPRIIQTAEDDFEISGFRPVEE